ncbi:hypothetical protein GCM10027449_07970 [Sinomonas notoginsengisoli]|uniref:gamma-glutamyl-gamma-aminobutyrate hydrolase family protein n=1 Tax=Sinomonas notoginsengisoli TaxID=1457311 RepID=UPI001F3D8C39|nr:gamma-glutamyl-gamma-aminobutyrate hydrolase family protein [Sinomonas notoginsengisoli]
MSGGAPRIAVTWAITAPSHEPWFHSELATLTANAATGLREAGAEPMVLDAAAGDLPDAVSLNAQFDGVVIMGGGDVDPAVYDGDAAHPTVSGVDRASDDAEARLVRDALASDMPVLGICRGLQIINVALGGTLHEDLPRTAPSGAAGIHLNHDDPKGPMVLHDVSMEPGTRLAEILGPTARVVSGHHQAVARVGDGLRVAATAPDGVVEAVELADPSDSTGSEGVTPWLLAVQWHPEDGQTRAAAPGQLEAILAAFVAACRE